jgi:gluconate 2-dehydrogenase gamma chain
MSSKINRRHFVRHCAVGMGAVTLLTQRVEAASRWRFLTPAEAELVDALGEQIIPGDEDPGAHEAGVVNFIDKQLAGFYRKHQTEYRRGLAGVDESSRSLFGKRFLDLEWAQQTQVMQALEAGKAPGETWKQQSPRSFFSLIRNHTMQGFYGSPRHGGNRNYVSYKMLALDYPQIIGQNRYRRS